MNDTTLIKIISMTFDYKKPGFTVESDWFFLAFLCLLFIIGYVIAKLIKRNNFPLVDLEIEISGSPKAVFKAKRDDSNIYIANRIYIELITRKAAILIDEQTDVISEVYSSWYKLFGIIRDEVKNVPGHYLRSHDSTNALIGLSTKILNDGLRPHLTKYHAVYEKWYIMELAKASSTGLSPQEVQRKFDKYDELIVDMKKVNQILIDYSKELKKLIEGK